MRVPDATRTGPVLFIGGWGRSGSTLVERMLAELDQVVVLGEVVHLWERGLRLNERCACGEYFHDCAFWREIGEVGFGGWANVDPDRLAFLKNAVDRHRRVIHTMKRTPPTSLLPLVREYDSYFQRVYSAALTSTGAEVVVDSSKEIPTALAMSHDPEIDLRVLHLVRDSRGVAFSWGKEVRRPESDAGGMMTRYSSAGSTLFWISGNLLPEGLKYRRVPTVRIRYEDVVADPQGTLTRMWRRLDLPGTVDLPISANNEIHLGRSHSVSGNPMRFKHGLTSIRRDDQWRSGMRRTDRILVTGLSLPLLLRFGYPLRADRRKG